MGTLLCEETMQMVAEMASLGLPTSFKGAHQKKSRKERAANKLDKTALLEDTIALETKVAQPRQSPSPLFSVQSVKLYSSREPALDEITLDRLHGLESSCAVKLEADDSLFQTNDEVSIVCETSLSPENKDSSPCELYAETESGNESSRASLWEAVWDEQYQCYFFCNTQSWESTWDPPPGFRDENAVSKDMPISCGVDGVELTRVSRIGEDLSDCLDPVKTVTNCVGVHSSVSGQCCGFDQTLECEGDADANACSRLSHQGLVGTPEQLKAVRVEIDVEDETVKTGVDQLVSTALSAEPFSLNRVHPRQIEGNDCQGPLTSCATLASKKELMDSLPVFPRACGTHTRFSDSEEDTAEVSGEETVNWEEIEDPQTPGRDGPYAISLQACSHGSEGGRLGQVESCSEVLPKSIKRRRIKSLSQSEGLEKVLLPGMSEMMSANLIKYWLQRYNLFSRYDKGVKLDEEGWFSVTPEVIAEHQASRCHMNVVVDAFTGVGGNAIQFALKKNYVIAIDIDPKRIELARHNAGIYGVSDRIEFIVGDFFVVAPFLKADTVFLSPPWGGPQYVKEETYDVAMLQPKDGFTLMKTALAVAPNIQLFLPRNVNLPQLKELAWVCNPPLPCRVEKNYVDYRLKAITAYYGDTAVEPTVEA